MYYGLYEMLTQLGVGECFLQCADAIALRFEGDTVVAPRGTVDLRDIPCKARKIQSWVVFFGELLQAVEHVNLVQHGRRLILLSLNANFQ